MTLVTVNGCQHQPACLVARYRHVVEGPGRRGDPDGFPWCTCARSEPECPVHGDEESKEG